MLLIGEAKDQRPAPGRSPRRCGRAHRVVLSRSSTSAVCGPSDSLSASTCEKQVCQECPTVAHEHIALAPEPGWLARCLAHDAGASRPAAGCLDIEEGRAVEQARIADVEQLGRDLAAAAIARSEKGFWYVRVANPIARLEVSLSRDRKDVEPMLAKTIVVNGETLLGAIGEIGGERLRRIKEHLVNWLMESGQ